MTAKSPLRLIAASALAGLFIGGGLLLTEDKSSSAPKVVVTPQPTVAPPAPTPKVEVPAPTPKVEVPAPVVQHTDDAERVKTTIRDRMAESMIERCEQDWLPSTCVKLRAELEAAGL